MTNKDQKIVLHATLAEHLFGSLPEDDEHKADYANDKNRFATSVGGHLQA